MNALGGLVALPMTRLPATGLGDYADLVYSVPVTVGQSTLPVILDTGSSDLWVTSDACSFGCDNTSKYPQSTFNSTGLQARLYYGDSSSATYAFGLIGKDTVSLAGLSLPQQYFAAINNTNTTIGETGSSGIFGLGFPINSIIFNNALNAAQSPLGTSLNTPHKTLSSFATLGPLVSRLVATDSLSEPLFTVSLQRDAIEIGGNVGMLTIGQLPANVKNETLTWVPIRGYEVDEGGLSAPPDSPNEVYPIAWEVFLDDVYLDGEKLPRSGLVSPDIKLSALIDTGNSIIRGPSDVVDFITTKLGTDFPCNEPHILAFSIGGKQFPIDPRDFIDQAYENNVSRCTAKLLATNTPIKGGNGFLYSWSLGDPFLKSVLSAFYYGNLTYPSRDPPRMGFLSTVPTDASDQLKAEVSSVAQNGHNFPTRVEPAPTGVPTESLFNSEGIATVSGLVSPTQTSGAIHTLHTGLYWVVIVLALVLW